MRVKAVIAVLLMALAAAAMILPTAGGGIETSIAFQRTDIAAIILAIALSGIALTVLVSTVGIILGAVGIAASFAAMSLFTGNPLLGGMAKLYIFLGPGLALAFGLAARMASMQAPKFRTPRLREPAASASPVMAAKVAERAEPQPEIAKTAPEASGSSENSDAAVSEPKAPPAEEPLATSEPLSEPAPDAMPESAPGAAPRAADPFVDEDEKNRLEFLRMRATETEDPESAAALWRQIAEEYPDYHPAMNAEAQLLHQLGRIREARERLDASLLAAPDELPTLSLAARYAASDKDFAAAERYWEQAFAAHDMNDGQAGAYINALIQQQKYEAASALYHRFANDWPDRPKLIRAGASAAEGRGAYDEAHELWQAAIALEPGVFSDTRRSIAALIAQGDLKGAARETRAYMQEAPDEPEPKALADRIVRLATTSESEDAMEVVAILGAQDAGYWAAWIESRLAAGDIVQAETAFQRATERGTKDAALLRAGALIALRAQRRDLEAERWSALAAITPDDLGAVRRAAVALSGTGDLEGARKLVADGLERQPDHMALLSLKANIAERTGRWASALEAWKALAIHHEASPHVIAHTARALRGLERFDEAQAIVRAGLKDAPDDLDLLLERARIGDDRLKAAPAGGDEAARQARLADWKAAVQARTTEIETWRGLILALLSDENTAGAAAALTHARNALEDDASLLEDARIQALAEANG